MTEIPARPGTAAAPPPGGVQPVIPASTVLPEITLKAAVLGVLLAVVLAGANAYVGLFAGMTVSASIPAAVISMAVLRLFRHSNILENNIVQTAASAGESLAAGAIFTLPALVMMGHWETFDFGWTTALLGVGGLVGVLFTIPLRRALIVEENLTFPEGIATAEVLKTGQAGTASGVRYLAMAGAVGALFKLGQQGLRVWTETLEVAGRVGSSVAYFGTNLSPMLVSVGYIVGMNIAVLVFLGGALNWLVAIPIYVASHPWPSVDGVPVAALDHAQSIWSTQTRYIGVGAMVIGGLWTLISLRGSILSGIRSGLAATRSVQGAPALDTPRTDLDTPMKWVLIAIIVAVVPIFVLYQGVVGSVGVSLPMAILMLIAAFLFSAVAAYMAGVVGSSNNPISGMTIATVLSSSLLLLALMGSEAESGPAAAILIGAVVCSAAAIGGDNMQDLKAGRIVGATPWKQQVMQAIGALSAAFVMAPVLMVLLKAYGFGEPTPEHPNPLAAPQATLMASVARGVFRGDLPWPMVWIGMLGGLVVIVLDKVQQARGASFRLPVLAVAVGVYLPFELSVPIFIGGIIAVVAGRLRRGLPKEETEVIGRRGLLFASGLITGEAFVGILMAFLIVGSGSETFLALVDSPIGAWPGLILLVVVAIWLLVVASRSEGSRAPR